MRRGVGDLVLVYKRVTSLAGHTSRVAELLEQVQRLSAGNPDDTTASLCAPRPLPALFIVMFVHVCAGPGAAPHSRQPRRHHHLPLSAPLNPCATQHVSQRTVRQCRTLWSLS